MKSTVCQEYQVDLKRKAIFAFESCRLLWWGWTVNSVCPKASAAHSVIPCGFPWESGLLPLLVEPPETTLCSTSLLVSRRTWQSHVLSGRFLEPGLLLCFLQGFGGVTALPVQKAKAGKPLEGYQGLQQWYSPSLSSFNTKLTSFSQVSSKATRCCNIVPSFDLNPGLPAANSIGTACFLSKAA